MGMGTRAVEEKRKFEHTSSPLSSISSRKRPLSAGTLYKMADPSPILQHLTGAGDVGLHIDDLVKLTSLKNRREIQPQLYDLQNKGQIERLPGNKWKACAITQEATPPVVNTSATPIPPTPPPAAMNGTAKTPTQTPPATGAADKPALNLPPSGKFASYKNALQEYCQKLKIPVASYASEKINTGFMGVVSFADVVVRADIAAPTAKEADLRAAFAALKKLEYFPADMQYTPTTTPKKEGALKRKEAPSNPSEPPAKQQQMEVDGAPSGPSFKSKLNELAQKNKLPAPTYDTVNSSNGFFSTVVFNGTNFKSAAPSSKKKNAEQSAAHMALFFLKQVTDPPQGYNPFNDVGSPPQKTDVISMIAEAREATKKPAPLSMKSRLQEYCQRSKKPLPAYQTDMRPDKTVISTVTVDGKSFTSDVSPSKKLAEHAAAEKALLDLDLLAKAS